MINHGRIEPAFSREVVDSAFLWITFQVTHKTWISYYGYSLKELIHTLHNPDGEMFLLMINTKRLVRHQSFVTQDATTWYL